MGFEHCTHVGNRYEQQREPLGYPTAPLLQHYLKTALLNPQIQQTVETDQSLVLISVGLLKSTIEDHFVSFVHDLL